MRKHGDTRRQATAWRCVLAASAAVLCADALQGAVVDWSATAASSSWATSGNWVGDVTPASDLLTDIARFNQASYTNQPDAGTRSVGGVQIGDGTTATAALTFSGAQLTLGLGGINMLANAGPATFSSPVTLGTGQTWTNASGSTLAINGAVTRTTGKTLNFVNSGAGSITSSTLSNDATGIIGPWASFGTGTSTRYATMSGSTVATYAGGTATGTAANITGSSTNYDYTGGSATLTTSLSANTIRYANATTSTIGLTLGTGNPTITLNGILNTGGGQFGIGYSAGTTGTIVIGSSNELVLNAANKIIAINAPIQDGGAAGSLTITGPNTVNFGAGPSNAAVTHTFTGGITINPGSKLTMGFQASAPNASSVTLNNGTLDLSSNSITTALGSGPLTINGGTITKSGGSGNTYTLGSQNWNADFTVSGTAKVGLGGAVTLAKNITVNVVSTGTASFVLPGAIGDGGNGYGITKTGAAVMVINGGGSTFSGPIRVIAGELDISASSGSVLTAGNVAHVDGGAILGIGTSESIGGLNDGATGGGTVRNASSSARTLSLTGSGDHSFSGVISNSTGGATLALSKTGNGTQVLSGANTYTGATAISNGLLKVNGSLAATAVTVNAGGRLGGNGSIGGRVTVAGGSASRGALDLRDGAVGTLSLNGNLTTTGTAGNYANAFVDLAAGGTSDLIAITGTPTIGAGGIKINLNALGDLQGGDYTLMTAAGGLGGANITLASDTLVYGGKTYTFSLANSSSTAEVLTVVIPEPTVMSLLATVTAGSLIRRRRECRLAGR